MKVLDARQNVNENVAPPIQMITVSMNFASHVKSSPSYYLHESPHQCGDRLNLFKSFPKLFFN